MKPPTKIEKAHHDRIAGLGCLVCGEAATIHHVTASIHGGRLTRSHRLVAPLCPPHHQKVYDPSARHPISVEGLGHSGFYRKHGIDLLAWSERAWENSCGTTEAF